MCGGVLIDFSDGSEARGSETLLIDISPVTCHSEIKAGGAGNGFLDGWYRLGCELLVSYGLVPKPDIPITCWGRGSVVWGTAAGGEVGIIRNSKIVPELTGANWG